MDVLDQTVKVKSSTFRGVSADRFRCLHVPLKYRYFQAILRWIFREHTGPAVINNETWIIASEQYIKTLYGIQCMN
jgi:hypothetical protein